ncbi:replication initiation factor domain-containing protein [Agathobaculum sp.]|uniref:replication initiation factor domain-containing protein n=1 Tax=Agathobaculum sp. TaxID=2048138 RepID=UPI002A7F34CC|nr:replication initiation factor domain-containing protein [Agathobaculum sp.]MDY3618088.1 replication initiation factor domain-containing protein [Agathobaculum sp.]
MKSAASIDWLTFSIKGETDPHAIVKRYLRIDPALFVDHPHGKYGYQRSMSFGNIFVFHDPAPDRIGDMGVCVSMSGSGCRTFEAHTTLHSKDDLTTPFLRLVEQLHADENVNVSRVDLALDDTEGYLDLEVIAAAVDENTINSRIRKRRVVKGYDGTIKDGTTVYIGAEQSDFRIRIYDKAKERYKPTEPEYNKHWVRFEIVMRGDNANGFVNALVNTDDLGLLASGILNDKIAFIERTETNITRCEVCKWWTDFVDSVANIKLVIKEETQHRLLKSIDWVKRQIAPTLSLINDAKGFFMIREILAIGTSKRTRQQQAILDDYRNSYYIDTRQATKAWSEQDGCTDQILLHVPVRSVYPD